MSAAAPCPVEALVLPDACLAVEAGYCRIIALEEPLKKGNPDKLAWADLPALKKCTDGVLRQMTHASGDPVILSEKVFVKNVKDLLAHLEVKALRNGVLSHTTHEALSSVLTQVVQYDSSKWRHHAHRLFSEFSDGTALLSVVRDSIATDDQLLRQVFQEGMGLCQGTKMGLCEDVPCLSRQHVWTYVQGKTKGAADQGPIVRDVGLKVTILMLGFVTEVATRVKMASEAYQCKFVAVTDRSESQAYSFIMCAILALELAYHHSVALDRFWAERSGIA